jgi:hypothetical protein
LATLKGRGEEESLLKHQAIEEFLTLQQLELEPLLAQPVQHTKHLGCQSCFPNRHLYFLSLEEITAHITGFLLFTCFLCGQ